MQSFRLIRFFGCIPLGGVLAWTGLAVWISLAPLSVLNRAQPVLAGKDMLLRGCVPSPVVVFGDSRADAAIDPSGIAAGMVNLAQGGGNPVVDFYRLRTFLRCPRQPDLVILSYNLMEFTRLTNSSFWEAAAYSHLLPFAERQEIVAAIRAGGGEPALVHPLRNEHKLEFSGMPPGIRDRLYQLYFPPFYGSGILASLRSGVFMRLADNTELEAAIITHRGKAEYPAHQRVEGPQRDAELTRASPNPVIDVYFQRMLLLLQERGIRSVFIAMPVNDATYAAMSPVVRNGLMDYLRSMHQRYSLLTLADHDLPHWPDRYFGDDDLHVNDAGTAAVTAIVNACLTARIAAGDRGDGLGCNLAPPRDAAIARAEPGGD